MREIKFRAQKKFTGNVNQLGWVYGLPRHFENAWYMHTLLNKVFPIDPETLSQYTGFKDKNGKELYEGDIVREWIKDNVLEDGGYWWHAKVDKMNGAYLLLQIGFDYDKSNCVFPEDFSFVYEYAKDCEIIGNIYENPELLNSTK